MTYPNGYQDLEIALANGEAVTELGYNPPPGTPAEPFNPTLTLPGGEAETRPPDQWVTSQSDIHPGDPPRGPYGQVPEGFGWPAAVAIRPGRWDLDSQSYRVAVGDTIAGLAASYLGSPGRLMEIWMLQPGERRQKSSADVLYPDEWLAMPDDAVATLYAAVGLPPPGGGTAAPPPPGGYVVTGSIAGTDIEKAKAADKNKKILIVAGAAAAGGLLLWALS